MVLRVDMSPSHRWRFLQMQMQDAGAGRVESVCLLSVCGGAEQINSRLIYPPRVRLGRAPSRSGPRLILHGSRAAS